MMNWLPAATDFRDQLKSILASADSNGRFDKLAALAHHRLNVLETLQLDGALGKCPRDAEATPAPIRLALLGANTLDHLAPAIRVAGLRRRILFDIHIGSYGQYRQELLNPSSQVHRFRPQIVLLSLSSRETLSALPLSSTEGEVQALIEQRIDEIRHLWRTARETLGAVVIQQTVLDVADPVFGSYDCVVPAAPCRVIARLNERMAQAASADGVLLLDIAGAATRQGIQFWHDRSRWLQGKLEIAPLAAPMYGEMLVRIVAAQRGMSRKCLVLDLDNTVWGGVIGDDGIEGIVLGEGSAAGEAHLALQRYAKQLSERGIILAICSKNEAAVAEAAFRDHPEMILKRSDIAAFVANWNDKSENLRVIAEQLNIGLDSLVFVDDNPVERARIRESLPMVAVPELPEDVSDYVPRVAEAGYFEAVAFTAEDRQRAQQYAANTERDLLRGSVQSIEDFLKGLDMSVDYGPVTPVSIDRVTQLINKTNQFNTTTRRYSPEEVVARSTSSDGLAFQFRLLDKFGDNGIVSVMILRPDDNERDVLEIESWVMSCRVFGRELEHEAMNIAVEAARDRGVRALSADYIPTTKNGVIRDLFPSLGFAPSDKDTPSNGPSRWILDVKNYDAHKTHISRIEKPQ